jgi:hypothetical protein
MDLDRAYLTAAGVWEALPGWRHVCAETLEQ